MYLLSEPPYVVVCHDQVVVKSFKVPVVEVVTARLSYESALPCTTDTTKKIFVDLTLVLDE